MQSSSNPALQEATTDPLLFATAFKKNRFYMISTREPEGSRDVFNEKPSREEQTIASVNPVKSLPTTATIRTTMGDIVLKLMPQFAPKSVENFIGLAKSGYYDNVIIHRVVKGFMIQTGDPNGNFVSLYLTQRISYLIGDGTGGESIFGGQFEDEFHPDAKHDRPYTLSMANAGPGTNGSQFFVTVVPAVTNLLSHSYDRN